MLFSKGIDWTRVWGLLMGLMVIAPNFSLGFTFRDQHKRRSSRQTLIFNIGVTPDPNRCDTPDGRDGTCVNLVECSDLYGRLRTNPTPDFINFLRKSICRYEKSTPVICCPKSEPINSSEEPVVITTTPTTTTSSTTTSSTTTPSTTTSSTTTTTTTTTTTITPAPTTLPPSGADLLPEECGPGEDVFVRIVGGTPAPVGRYPWIAALGYEDGQGVIEFLCGGALITNQHIVTAAHCVRNRNDLKVVRLGEHNLNTETDGVHEDFEIELRMINENFSPISFANDIAILKLAKKVTFRDRIQPVCLPFDAEKFAPGNLVTESGLVAGWGAVSFNNVSSSVLLHVPLPIIPEAECREKYEVFNQVVIDESTLCAGRGGQDACQGDSGGPMVYKPRKDKFYIIGVVSFGFRCAEPKYPGVYTRVSQFTDWIISHLN